MLTPIQDRTLDMLMSDCDREQVLQAVNLPFHVLHRWRKNPDFREEMNRRTLLLQDQAEEQFRKLGPLIAEAGRKAAEYLREHQQRLREQGPKPKPKRSKPGQKRTRPS
jgi:hypothetical protein